MIDLPHGRGPFEILSPKGRALRPALAVDEHRPVLEQTSVMASERRESIPVPWLA